MVKYKWRDVGGYCEGAASTDDSVEVSKVPPKGEVIYRHAYIHFVDVALVKTTTC